MQVNGLKFIASVFRRSEKGATAVEFAILLPACGMERAEALAETLRSQVQALTVAHDGRAFGVTVCIGITPVSPGDNGPRDVMSRADEGCYMAKSRGRNAVVSVPAPPDDGEV